ncbi:hypothetical protein GCM10009738_40060 [Kitasatospora viridis]|uniref:Uncharacterized protein n=1 Tax=Kitasatospora viridis TaxID=281105 RepID=A0A561T6Z2_9ACTN|nr:hypothetical protein FHX73_14351 [Kitasatospora viridis]
MPKKDKSSMTLKIYRLTPAGEREVLRSFTIRLGDRYHPLAIPEWPDCRCSRCRVAAG